MKKRITLLALLIVLAFAFCAWAGEGDNSFTLDEQSFATLTEPLLVGTSLTKTYTIDGAAAGTTFTVTGLPNGLRYSSNTTTTTTTEGETTTTTYNSTLTISGKPSAPGEYATVIKARTGSTTTTTKWTMYVVKTPLITTSNIPAVVWSKDYSFTLAASGGTKNLPIVWSVEGAAQVALPSLRGADGDDAGTALFGAGDLLLYSDGSIKGVYAEGDEDNGINFKTSKTYTKEVTLKAAIKGLDTKEGYYTTKKFNVSINAVAPKIDKSSLTLNKTIQLGGYSESSMPSRRVLNRREGEGTNEQEITATGPGEITWTVTGAVEALKVTSTDPTVTAPDSKLKITAAPEDLMKNASLTVTAKNSAGSDSVTFRYTVTTNAITIDSTMADALPKTTLPESEGSITGAFKLGDKFSTTQGTIPTRREGELTNDATHAYIKATPGPITWKAQNLPGGVTLKVSKDTTIAWLEIKDTGFSAINLKLSTDKTTYYAPNYVITATNTVSKQAASIDHPLYVYNKPEVSTKKLPTLTTGKAYSSPIAFKGIVEEYTLTIADTAANEALPSRRALNRKATTITNYGVTSEGENATYKLSFSSKDLKITGSLDTIPASGKIYVTIEPKNAAYSTEDQNGDGSGYEKVILSFDVVGVPPKVGTIKNLSTKNTANDEVTFDITGTKRSTGDNQKSGNLQGSTLYMVAYIASQDLIKHGLVPDTSSNTSGDHLVLEMTAYSSGNEALPTRRAGTIRTASTKKAPARKVPNRRNGPTATTAENLGLTVKYEDVANSDITRIHVAYNAPDDGGASKYALNQLPITFLISNDSMAEGQSLTKKLNVTLEGKGVEWTIGEGEAAELASKDFTVAGAAGGDFKYGEATKLELTASGDKPYEITFTPAYEADNHVKGVDPALVVEYDNDAGTAKLSGKIPVAYNSKTKAYDSTGESKTTVTITVTNPSTKKKYSRKVTITGQTAPVITNKKVTYGENNDEVVLKEIELGKAPGLKMTATGSKPITWAIGGDNANDDIAKLTAIGLSFDSKTGEFKLSKDAVLYPTTETLTASVTNGDGRSVGPTYTPLELTVVALNDAVAPNATGGTNKATVVIGVKGTKPKLLTNQVIVQLDPDGTNYIVRSNTDKEGYLRTTISSSDKKGNVQWAISEPDDIPTELMNLKMADSDSENGALPRRRDGEESTSDPTRNLGLFNVEDLASATKGTNIKVSADNLGSVVTGNVKVVVWDKSPDITSIKSPDAIAYMQADENNNVTKTIEFALDDDCVTGDTVINWKLSTKPGSPKVKSAFSVAKDYKSATVTLTINKKLSSKDLAPDNEDKRIIHTFFAVTATNKFSGATDIRKVSLDVYPYDIEDELPTDDYEGTGGGEDALPTQRGETPEGAEAEESEEAESALTFGEERTADSLTAEQRAFFAENGYVIAAVLPEVTATEDGQFDIEAELAEEASTGAKLYWFAFPQDVEESEDDEIVEFYDEAGAETEIVPESHQVIVSPWLNAEVTYAPVIAVRAEDASGAKDSVEGAEAGDVVTEKALEGEKAE